MSCGVHDSDQGRCGVVRCELTPRGDDYIPYYSLCRGHRNQMSEGMDPILESIQFFFNSFLIALKACFLKYYLLTFIMQRSEMFYWFICGADLLSYLFILFF